MRLVLFLTNSVCWLLFTPLLPSGFRLHRLLSVPTGVIKWLLGCQCQYAFFSPLWLPSDLNLAFPLRLLATSTLKLFPWVSVTHFLLLHCLTPLYRLWPPLSLSFNWCSVTSLLLLCTLLLTNIHDFSYLLHLDAPQIFHPNLFSPCRYVCWLLLGISTGSVLPGLHSCGFGMLGAPLNASSSPICLANTSDSPKLKWILFFNFLSHGYYKSSQISLIFAIIPHLPYHLKSVIPYSQILEFLLFLQLTYAFQSTSPLWHINTIMSLLHFTILH